MKPGILAVALLMPVCFAVPVKAENPEHVQRLLIYKECQFCDLSNVNLTGYDLSGANLKGANLLNANLTSVVLAGADLTAATLENANLNNAVLNGANLSGTKMRFANLQYASLQGVKAKEAFDVTGADLTGTIMPSGLVYKPLAEGQKKPAPETGKPLNQDRSDPINP
ncbi:pentapeptide repeat-containing protein [Coleofasciculus sp. FACHB-64]|uniref:pentapeptide repeat-containing protein n=1 Tax=Cyanophyceae TaxID=3028117 RepID=UPI0016845469|nr:MULTISPECIES: pentapeptide repeat-containing protein [unclassified Coleofasciculus]MBD1836865.1 pentapeptide repeat-containing protein [Coleofasciculus sp. FACHB-501]MBD1897453.1 pentapeptide repeat-containing protein [Coleofasciculus sp. FACHB-129]MBD1899837.1 pentapeptide repeat-containing protein [Coleofasciculus sp. FACHB-125]MBD1941567.1 pentapeptide repeat-containing protein [Coleofasciculus sp. FACHB-712]MBD2046803.1 pentapeptide repeat-containing protein [Coleofasciculus sp. FACHB-6